MLTFGGRTHVYLNRVYLKTARTIISPFVVGRRKARPHLSSTNEIDGQDRLLDVLTETLLFFFCSRAHRADGNCARRGKERRWLFARETSPSPDDLDSITIRYRELLI